MSPPRPDSRPLVLAVDDDALILRYLRIALERSGYRPVTADDSSSALQLVRDSAPDLILLDVRLPDTDGFSLYEEIRALSSSPVIFLSAGNRAEDRSRAMGLGASAFVIKPFSPIDLMKTIGEIIGDY